MAFWSSFWPAALFIMICPPKIDFLWIGYRACLNGDLKKMHTRVRVHIESWNGLFWKGL